MKTDFRIASLSVEGNGDGRRRYGVEDRRACESPRSRKSIAPVSNF